MAKSIEITTTQNVTIEYELAQLRERVLAFLLDVVLVLIAYFIAFQLILLFASSDVFNSMGWQVTLGILPFMLFFGYNILFEILRIGQTPGKMAMGIKVVRLDGKEPEWSDVVLRSTLHLVDTIFSVVIGALLIKTTDKCQRLGDMSANTTVIKISGTQSRFKLQDILSISSLDTYEPVYPQVRNLAEKDMIFIKNVITRSQRYPNYAHEAVVEDLVSHLMPILDIEQRPLNRIEFLKTLLRDYIVLTR